MSLLQKIFNIIHSSPRGSHFKVRDLNIYFKEAINPTYKLINLDYIDSLELQIEYEDKDYNLIAFVVKNGKESEIILGTFYTKKEAEEAFHQVKNRIFGGGKTLLGIFNGIVLLIIYTAFIFSFANIFKTSSNLNTSMSNVSSLATGDATNMNLSNPANSNINMADMSKLQKQLLQQALSQAGQQGLTGSNLPNLANSPIGNSGNAINNIVSDAIQQAQGQNPVDGQPTQQITNKPQAVEQTRTAGDDLLNQIKK